MKPIAVNTLPKDYQKLVEKFGLDCNANKDCNGTISKEKLDHFDATTLSLHDREIFHRLKLALEIPDDSTVLTLAKPTYAGLPTSLRRDGRITKSVHGDSTLAIGAFSGTAGHGISVSGELGPQVILSGDSYGNSTGQASGFRLSLHPEFSGRFNLTTNSVDDLRVHLPIADYTMYEQPLAFRSARIFSVGVTYNDIASLGYHQAGLSVEALRGHFGTRHQGRFVADGRYDFGEMVLGNAFRPANATITPTVSGHLGVGIDVGGALSADDTNVLHAGGSLDYWTEFMNGVSQMYIADLEVGYDRIAGSKFGVSLHLSQKVLDTDPGAGNNHILNDTSYTLSLSRHL